MIEITIAQFLFEGGINQMVSEPFISYKWIYDLSDEKSENSESYPNSQIRLYYIVRFFETGGNEVGNF